MVFLLTWNPGAEHISVSGNKFSNSDGHARRLKPITAPSHAGE